MVPSVQRWMSVDAAAAPVITMALLRLEERVCRQEEREESDDAANEKPAAMLLHYCCQVWRQAAHAVVRATVWLV